MTVLVSGFTLSVSKCQRLLGSRTHGSVVVVESSCTVFFLGWFVNVVRTVVIKDSVTGSVTVIYTFLPYGYALNCIAASTVAAYQTGPKTHWRFRSGGLMSLNRRLPRTWSRTQITCDYGPADQNPHGTISETLVRSKPPRTKITGVGPKSLVILVRRNNIGDFGPPGLKSPGPKFR